MVEMFVLQEDVTQMYEELQGFFNPMLGFGLDGEDESGTATDSGFGFSEGRNDLVWRQSRFSLILFVQFVKFDNCF